MDIRIFAPEEMIDTEIALPLSKSMSNRALLMHALSPDAGEMYDVAACDDTEAMVSALKAPLTGTIDIGAAGTAMRFLTAYFASKEGADVILDGTERMRQRPIAPLVNALRSVGADIEYVGTEGCPPLRIRGHRLQGKRVEIDATVSSQFISALLMVAPTFDSPLTLVLRGEPSSLPYINMTIEMMQRRGIDVVKEYDEITVSPGTYHELEASDIESDWSAASYWYSIAALSTGWITLPKLKYPSVQGDSVIAEMFERLGVITSTEEGVLQLSASPEVYSRLDADFSDCPDVAQTLIVACCMVGVPFKFTGVESLRVKETDRLEAMRAEMLKLGYVLEIENDSCIKWDGRRMRVTELPVIDTYADHRMAMAIAPAAIFASGMVIRDCEVVSKSYPGFWRDLQHAGFLLADANAPLVEEQ